MATPQDPNNNLQKQTYPANDAQPVVIYAQTSSTGTLAQPVLATSSGCLMISNGLDIPNYYTVVLSYTTGNLSNCYYYDINNNLLATLTLQYAGNALVSVARS